MSSGGSADVNSGGSADVNSGGLGEAEAEPDPFGDLADTCVAIRAEVISSDMVMDHTEIACPPCAHEPMSLVASLRSTFK
eukprot:3513372-Prymnesium_polylepis.1